MIKLGGLIATGAVLASLGASPALAEPPGGVAGTVQLPVGTEFPVRLPLQGGTGYSWTLDHDVPGIVQLGPPTTGLARRPGGPQLQVFHFRATEIGRREISFSYGQPWQGGAKAVRTHRILVIARRG